MRESGATSGAPLGRTLCLAGISLTCLAALGGCGGSSGNPIAAPGGFPGGAAIPAKPAAPISLTDYQGHKVNLASLTGRPVLVAFLYTHCPNVCPLMTAELHNTLEKLGPYRSRQLQIVAISVDPHHDTANRLPGS